METLQLLLVDTTELLKNHLEETSRQGTESSQFLVRRLGPKSEITDFMSAPCDAIVFGERLGVATVAQCARSIRSAGIKAPLFALTRISEAGVPRNLQKAGIDEMLNVAELSSPLFSWTFTSLVRQVRDRKKAAEFDQLNGRLEQVGQSLSFITHELTSPLSVIRLVLYHLEAPGLTPQKRETLLKMLSSNVDRVDAQIEELRVVRRRLANGAPAEKAAPKVFKAKLATATA